jgi:hypothetical protein
VFYTYYAVKNTDILNSFALVMKYIVVRSFLQPVASNKQAMIAVYSFSLARSWSQLKNHEAEEYYYFK